MSEFEPHRFGDYLLQSRLGHGGMAEVFLAQREGAAGFARTMVVKRILRAHQQDPSFVDMFIHEAKIAAQLTHPNIVQVHELGRVQGEFFIAMEYVRGDDLLRILRRLSEMRPGAGAVPPAVAAYIARETCRALQHAHDHLDRDGRSQPIIHRDVSPQNIMISYDGQVKLVDFGIAKAIGGMREETRTGVLKGKFAYMAPEQIAGSPPSPQSDVFAAGVVLHEMLTGRRLFKGATDLDTVSMLKSMPVPVPSSLWGGVPAALDQVTARALDRDRTTRYLRAGQMARDLDHYLQGVRFSVEDMAEFTTATFHWKAPTSPPIGQEGEVTVVDVLMPPECDRTLRATFHTGTHFSFEDGTPTVPAQETRCRNSLWTAALALTVGLLAIGILFWRRPIVVRAAMAPIFDGQKNKRPAVHLQASPRVEPSGEAPPGTGSAEPSPSP